MPKELEGMTYEEQMRIFCLFSSEKRRVQSDLIAAYELLMSSSFWCPVMECIKAT